MDFEGAKKLIEESNTICLISHKQPDGDAIGSIGAMYHFLKELGKEVYMVVPDMPLKFNFMPNTEKVMQNLPDDINIDLLICLDCSEIERRTCVAKETIERACKLMVIDHHIGASDNVDVKVVDTNAPANCEIVYKVIKYMGHPVSKETASYLYLGILTDTGNFNYERTTGNTLRIAGEFVDMGIDFVTICKKMNDTYTENKMKAVAYVINNTEKYYDGKLRIAVVDKEYQEKNNSKDEDVECLVNYLRCVENTIVSIYIRWVKDDIYKVSIRSDEPIDATVIAKAFNGGGHKRAAGFETTNLEDTKEKLIQMLEGLL